MKNRLTFTSMGSLFVLGMGLLCCASSVDRAYAKNPAMAQGDSTTASINAEQFIKKAAMSGLAEVELGQLAQRKAASEGVREFGKTMVADHTKVNQQLESIASVHGMKMPRHLDEAHLQVKQRLEQLEGAEFDRAYMEQMIEDHNQAVLLFERGQFVEPPDVRMLAQTTLPTLRRHLKQVQTLISDIDGYDRQ